MLQDSLPAILCVFRKTRPFENPGGDAGSASGCRWNSAGIRCGRKREDGGNSDDATLVCISRTEDAADLMPVENAVHFLESSSLGGWFCDILIIVWV